MERPARASSKQREPIDVLSPTVKNSMSRIVVPSMMHELLADGGAEQPQKSLPDEVGRDVGDDQIEQHLANAVAQLAAQAHVLHPVVGHPAIGLQIVGRFGGQFQTRGGRQLSGYVLRVRLRGSQIHRFRSCFGSGVGSSRIWSRESTRSSAAHPVRAARSMTAACNLSEKASWLNCCTWFRTLSGSNFIDSKRSRAW